MLKNNEWLTNEAVKIIRVAGVIWNGETAITDGHLAFTKGQSEEAQLVQQTAQRLEKTITCKPRHTKHKRQKSREEKINQEHQEHTVSHTTNTISPLNTSWHKAKNYIAETKALAFELQKYF